MRRRTIQFIWLCATVVSTSPLVYGVEYADGTGEPNNPYLIATAEQFLGADFSQRGVYYRLSSDIDLSGKSASLRYQYFVAHLDGAGFKIHNAATPWGGGLFGCIDDEASIANLILVNVALSRTAWPGVWADSTSVGGFADRNWGTITNCGVTGLIATWRVCGVGGFVGINEYEGSIVNCFFDGWVGATWEAMYLDDEGPSAKAGGLVSDNGGLVANSFSCGIVLGDGGVGGLVGRNWGTIENCYSMCSVLGEVGAGGLVADNAWGCLRNCYAAGQVTGEMRGGLVGMAGVCSGRVENCLWHMDLSDCGMSGAGVGVRGSTWGFDLANLSFNGWAGDPNWIFPDDCDTYGCYPFLAWEGIAGDIIPELSPGHFGGGDGTESHPYVIATPEALGDLRERSIFWDKHFILVNDLDVRGQYLSIGVCSGSSFSGTFDGNGHAIRNFSYGVEGDGPVWNIGLFGHVTGEVRNLTVENFRVIGGRNSRRIGLLAGTNDGLLKNCSVGGSITVGENSRYTGQLIGLNFGQVIDCNATATVQAGEGSTDIGGLIGADSPTSYECQY